MTLQCKICGAPVPGWASFCNKCGAPVQAGKIPDHLVCPNCGKIQSDLRSRFCDRCGVPVTSPVQPRCPAAPALHTKACPRCGFTNNGVSLFFCKKCGASLDGNEIQRDITEPRLPEGAARIAIGGGKAMRQEPGKSAARSSIMPVKVQEARLKYARSYQKLAIGIAMLLLILAVIAGVFFFTKNPGTSAGSPDNNTGSGLLGLIPTGDILGALLGNGTAPDLGKIFPNKNAGAGLVTNQAVSVVIDTPLKIK